MTDLNDIVSTTIRARAEQMAKNIQTNALVHRLIDNLPPPKPLTPLERLQRKLADYERTRKGGRPKQPSIMSRPDQPDIGFTIRNGR